MELKHKSPKDWDSQPPLSFIQYAGLPSEIRSDLKTPYWISLNYQQTLKYKSEPELRCYLKRNGSWSAVKQPLLRFNQKFYAFLPYNNLKLSLPSSKVNDDPDAAFVSEPYVAPRPIPIVSAPAVENTEPSPKAPPKSLEDCEQRLKAARELIKQNGYKAKYSDQQLEEMVNQDEISQARFLVSFQPVNNDPNAKLAYQKESGLVAVWATSLEMIENADTDPQIIADLLATDYDPAKDYVMHIVDRGENLKGFGENTIVPTWDNLKQPAKDYLGDTHSKETLESVLNTEYQKEYAVHMAKYKESGLSEFNERDQLRFASTLDSKNRNKFQARHELRTEFGANNEFTGNGMTQCRHSGNSNGVVETLTLENNPPPIKRMVNVKTIRLSPIKG